MLRKNTQERRPEDIPHNPVPGVSRAFCTNAAGIKCPEPHPKSFQPLTERFGIVRRQHPVVVVDDTFILPGPSVWVYAQVFEEDAAIITPGMPITIDVPADPGTSFATTVFSIDPTVNPETRTVRVRAQVATPHENLRPGAFVTATLHIPLGEQLAIPRSAVLLSGTHRLVFVVAPDGRFTPRDVELGRLAGDYYEVRAGLTAGEDVVTAANFLIDSESRLKAAVAAFTPPGEGHPGAGH